MFTQIDGISSKQSSKHRIDIQAEIESQTLVFGGLSRNSSFSSYAGIDDHLHSKDTFFCFTITERVSCHQRFIGLITNGAGNQVLGVGDNKNECFV